MFHDHEHGPAPFAADGEPLHKPQHDQQHRREHARLLIGGQHADEKRGHSHHHQRGHEHGLAAHAIAEVPEDHAAERPGEKPDRIRRERGHRAGHRIERGKEEPIEHQRRRRAVEEEIIPLDGGADETGHDDPSHGVVGGTLAAHADTALWGTPAESGKPA